MKPLALILRTAGTNCDAEMVRAFQLAGAETELVHLDHLIGDPSQVERFDLIGFPGGFSYGDDVAAGRIFAVRIREHLYPALRAAADRGVPMIGACNGFQVLVQTGLLPGSEQGQWPEEPAPQATALAANAGGRFIDRWLHMAPVANTRCIWTRGLDHFVSSSSSQAASRKPHPDLLMLPIAHGEGCFLTSSPTILQQLEQNGQVAIRYAPHDNPNGSESDIAGICDPSGRIFGLMPHPERYLSWRNHPWWTRLPAESMTGDTPGLRMFKNAVEAVVGVTSSAR
ncbi:MAG TPA: phosphoribosylformylglycinamidine synthase subunit PurQ [Phycisphaerales bacterium]|nr:phosphoribosylformylglycinamidine synthase subunit PurQ [Phycisphaerales bacterium]